jgi:aminoglycoside phosphotransferase family enzyme/predicted kinase
MQLGTTMSGPLSTNSQSGKHETSASTPDPQELVAALQRAIAYADCLADAVVIMHETHISWVFLAGDHAYKVKKPVKTQFLDYTTLDRREQFCHQEVRLNRRYAPDLYLGVVPITRQHGNVQVGGEGKPIEFAVKMRRFPEEALLSQRLQSGKMTDDEIRQLAVTVATFHQTASVSDPQQPWGRPEIVLREALDNFADLQSVVESGSLDLSTRERLRLLECWTRTAYQERSAQMASRREQGFVRECHGDLHLGNVIHWNGRWIPFDGIEFNDEFRWIDVLSDAAFLAMDLAAQNRLELCHSFINAYLERTGDYEAMSLMRWYLIYRALVRAKVAAIRSRQSGQPLQEQIEERRDCVAHIDLAARWTASPKARLWITHGVSGSGKTFGSESLVRDRGAIRLRSDVERKRMFGLEPSQRPTGIARDQVYGSLATLQTYDRLYHLAQSLLRAGESVVVDATFLKHRDRQRFRELAACEQVDFRILSFHAERSELERRLRLRAQKNDDASDAGLGVLLQQLESLEPLTAEEQVWIEPRSSHATSALREND